MRRRRERWREWWRAGRLVIVVGGMETTQWSGTRRVLRRVCRHVVERWHQKQLPAKL